MRIDAYNAINQIQSTSKVNKMTGKEKTNVTDKFEISQAGKDIQVAKKAVSEAPDVRQNLVNDIKARLNSGTYQVSDEEFAQKMVEKMFGQ